MTTRRSFITRLSTISGCLLCSSQKSFSAEGVHWAYAGAEGPDHWGEIDPAAQTCSLGKEQSPIDIVGSTRSNLPPIELSWKPLAGEIVNNGHTQQVNVTSGGGMAVGAEHYDLLQFHFHAPSEHRVDGRSFPMEVHFVHKNAASGALGVLGVFMVAGRANPAFTGIASAMPLKAGESVRAPAGLDLHALVPPSRRYFAYEGSLTTPPCSETVDWRVCIDPIEVDAADIARFTALYAMNARPLQARHRRYVLISE